MENHIFGLIKEEKNRQESTINLIASENYASKAVLEATGSVLTNKYAEGYPGKRYYSGCETIDKIEDYAKDLGKKLFEADHVNVQPHSGSQANMAVYLSILKPGDTVLGMGLGSGGHLTHGHKINFSGKIFNFVPYNVNPENELIDYNEIEILTNQHQPKLIVAGASAYSRIIDFAAISKIAKDNNALLMTDIAHIAGLVIAGLHPSPVSVADFVTSTTHKTLRGPRGGLILSTAEYGQKLDRSVMPGSQGGPLMHSIAAKAVAFEEAQTPAFKEYQKQVVLNSKAMCTEFKNLGYHIVSNGTDNHVFLINLKKTCNSSNNELSGQEITGDIVERALEKAGITLNRNSVPFDTESPLITSGIRIGTPAITTRGFKENEVKQIAHWVHEVIKKRNDEMFLQNLKEEINIFCKNFPIY
ncbi:serine hydroxymethyltransferase [Candidatus Babeliales bacterium]|nr:serine hydroxymethyltransferase [Candidatus Babeliales bacterium]